MNSSVHITRTTSGYEFNGLAVTGLAPRESQVLLLRASGLSVKECSANLNCGPQAIKSRMTNLFYKLNANNATDLVTKAFKTGFLRVLILLLAFNVVWSTPLSDRDAIARAGRTRPRSTQRTARVMRSDGLLWNPDTNELI